MPDQTEVAPSAIEATYKAREVEGFVDIYFYRKIGFRIAQYFAKRNVRPATVTLLGGVFGVLAGHFYYYRDLRINLLGIAFHIAANALDNADGQLARLLNQQSRFGRLLDGVVDHVIWLSIYFHLALRHVAQGGSSWIWLVAAMAALSHGLQAATADYCRNGYLYFVKDRTGVDFDSSAGLEKDSRQLTWRGAALEKLFLIFYSNITRQQEVLVPGLKQVREKVGRDFPDELPEWGMIALPHDRSSGAEVVRLADDERAHISSFLSLCHCRADVVFLDRDHNLQRFARLRDFSATRDIRIVARTTRKAS